MSRGVFNTEAAISAPRKFDEAGFDHAGQPDRSYLSTARGTDVMAGFKEAWTRC